MPIVETRSGRIEGLEEQGLQIFRGVPYAQPPVGSLRFAAPEREKPWTGIQKAHEFGFSAPQSPMMIPLPGMDVGAMDEDCLYLNVYTPGADSARRPVMVWIHGGGFVIGSGSQVIYDGAPLAERGDVVVVTINYRLGPLGFLYLADLCPGLEGAVGNAGIRDQVAALEWVKENIAAFGGDPENVTIFGESAGGMSVGTLLGTPSADGLFQRAIPQSGAAHNVHTRETATEVARHFLESLDITPDEVNLKLRSISPDKLLDTQQQTVLKLGTSVGLLPFQPLVDGDFLQESPLAAVAAGSARGVDLMLGTTRDEWKLFGFLDSGLAELEEAGLISRLAAQLGDEASARRIVETYRDAREDGDARSAKNLFFAIETDRVFRIPAIRLAEAQQRHHDAVFMYLFTWESPMMGGALGSCHAVELPFVFGKLGAPGADSFTGSGPEADRLSEYLMDAWLAFARSGNPSHPGLPGGQWPTYERERRATMNFGRETICDDAPGDRERSSWDGLL
ncbi:MAG: carboxylesterase/lipase family protein [bacterium]|nr:carboxylesterase/lipase family protein [bacterium]MCP5065919.1 carboxylesterase/lipase family protein [bacterium]